MFYMECFWIGAVLLLTKQVAAQYERACYWYNGTATSESSQGPYGACYADGDSHCCLVGEACLSNGLCFGAQAGTVSYIARANWLHLEYWLMSSKSCIVARVRTANGEIRPLVRNTVEVLKVCTFRADGRSKVIAHKESRLHLKRALGKPRTIPSAMT
jgi:hypothetical protein